MARTVTDAKLGNRTSRAKLKISSKPYYKAIHPGLHLGYRKGKTGARWVMRYYIANGKYKVETLPGAVDDNPDANSGTILNFAQAQAVVVQLHQRRLAEAKGLKVETGPYTVADCIADYLDYLEARKKGGSETRQRAEALILPKLGKIDTADLAHDIIESWHENMAKTPARVRTTKDQPQQYKKSDDPEDARRRKSTANRTLTVLRAALNRAYKRRKIATDEAWRHVEAFRAVDAARVRYLTVADARRLINACAEDFRRLVRAALATGARYGELCALRVEDFNPDAGTVHVRMSKTGASRHIALNDEGFALFQACTTGRLGTETMFLRSDGYPWRKSMQVPPMRAACERAKIEPPIGFHGMRHTYASLSIMAGAPLIVIAQNLGHRTTAMIERHYGHLAASFMAETIKRTAPSFGFVDDTNVIPMGGGR